MAPKREFEPAANDHVAGSSRRPAPVVFAMGPSAPLIRDRIYVTVAVAHMFWEAGVPMSWGDVHLPHGWHLSPDRVSVPPIPVSGCVRVAENRRRSVQLPADLQEDPAYDDTSPSWDLWFEVEHDARRHRRFTSAMARHRAQPRMPARRDGRRPDGLYIDELALAPVQVPQAQAQPQEEDDPELQAALAASRELNDLKELAKWPHLAKAL
ncbi:hypothetical protein QYE76_049462 [Lolium multiflorum]|uniref:Uncharacterized protein n=1 Tax=Lolium multiflorum TaxID=4521 RepID=A0AAD8SN29_LOLMU|nr:hypothetical protein QYE76_049462 [Lolium multiflorum]